ncbi:Dml [Symbiodinium microadriaticum]|nr:Dml [Symbiodinium microadriaticum]
MLFGERDPVKEPGTDTGTPGNWWTVFALVPDAFIHSVQGFQFYRDPERKLDPVLRELGQTRAGYLCSSQFVFSQHCKSCRSVGMTEEMIEAIPHWSVADCWTPVQRACLAYTDEMVTGLGRVSDGTFEALKSHLSEEEILEFTYITALYMKHAVMSRALRLEYDDVPERIVEIAAPEGFNADVMNMVDKKKAIHEFYERDMGFELVKVEVAPVTEGGWAKHFFYRMEDDSKFIAFWEMHDIPGVEDFETNLSKAAGVPAQINHIAFDVHSEEELATARDRWLAGGHDVMEIDHNWCKSIYTRDPNDNVVEFCLTTGEFTQADRDEAMAAFDMTEAQFSKPPADMKLYEAKNYQTIVAPGIYDGLSARIADKAGFSALYMTGYGVSASLLGQPDAGFLTATHMVDRVRMICSVTDTPLIADADTGFGGLVNVAEAVRGYEAAGASVIQIEDQEFPKRCGHTKNRRVIALDEAAAKIQMAAETKSENGIMVMARTDARTSLGLDEALRRGDAFLKAGADILFIESPESEDEMRVIGEAFKGTPLLANMVPGGRTPKLADEDLAALGFNIIIYPVWGLAAAAAALTKGYDALNGGDAPTMMDFEDINKLMGFEEIWKLDDRFGSVQAQEEAEDNRAVLEEIVVTAQKRAENIQDVPISITAISGEDIRAKNIETLNDLSALTPNTEIQAMPTLSFIYMRGLGSGFNIGFEQSVGTFIDGIFLGRMSYLSDGMLDIERVEVLRGPQGTLLGKNTIAGALSITTGTPVPEFMVDFAGQMGDFDQRKVEAMINAPLFNDAVILRAAFSKNDRDGYIHNTMIDVDEWNTDTMNWRVKVKFQPWDNLDATLAVTGAETIQVGQGAQLKVLPEEYAVVMRLFDPEVEGDISNYQSSLDRLSGIERETDGATLTVNWDVLSHTLTWISGYTGYTQDTLWDADISPIPFLTLEGPEDYEQITHELRVLSPAGERWEYIVGLYYFENNVYNDTIVNVINSPDPIQTVGGVLTPQALAGLLLPNLPGIGGFQGEESRKIYDQDATSLAGFTQVTFDLFDDLSLIGGVRYSVEEKEIRFVHSLSTGGVPGLGVVFRALTESEEVDTVRSREETNISPKFSVRYHWSDEITLYGTYAEGWKGGGYNATANRAEHLEFDAENSTTFEAGVKTRLLGGAMTLNVGLFHTNFENLQVSVFNGLQFIVQNAAEATTQGVEWDAAMLLPLQPVGDFFLTLSGGYVDGVYDSFPNGPCQAEEETPCDLTGNQLANAPEWNGALGINYQRMLGNTGLMFFAGADVLYQSEIFFDTDLDPADYQDAMTKLNGRVGLGAEDGLWSFVVHGRNLTDELDLVVSSDGEILMIDVYFCPTPNCQKVTIMLEECGLDYQSHKIDILDGDQNQPDFLKLNPNRKVPVIVDQDGPGGKPLTLWESGAILLYLAEKTGQFMSQDPVARAEVQQWLMWQMAYIGPMMGQLHHFVMYAPEDLPYAKDRYMAETHRLRALLDDQLDGQDYVVGNDVSIVDFAIYPWVKGFGFRYPPDRDLSHVDAWFERLEARPALMRGFTHNIDTIRPEVIGQKPVTDDIRKSLFASFQDD